MLRWSWGEKGRLAAVLAVVVVVVGYAAFTPTKAPSAPVVVTDDLEDGVEYRTVPWPAARVDVDTLLRDLGRDHWVFVGVVPSPEPYAIFTRTWEPDLPGVRAFEGPPR